MSVARGGVWSPGEGSRVSFVGRLSQPAAAWDGRLEELGLTRGALAKSTAVLVAADPVAPLATVAKARAAGIPVVDEASFVELLDVLEERQHSPADEVDATDPVVDPEPVEPAPVEPAAVEPAAAPAPEAQEPEPAPEAQKPEPQQPPAQQPAAQIATPVQAVATPQQPAPYGVESKKSVSPALGCGCATIALFVVVVVVLVLLMV